MLPIYDSLSLEKVNCNNGIITYFIYTVTVIFIIVNEILCEKLYVFDNENYHPMGCDSLVAIGTFFRFIFLRHP